MLGEPLTRSGILEDTSPETTSEAQTLISALQNFISSTILNLSHSDEHPAERHTNECALI